MVDPLLLLWEKGCKALFDTTDTFDDTFGVVACKQCEAIYLSPHPTAEQLDQAYSDHYYGTGEKKFDAKTEGILTYFRFRRAQVLRKKLGREGRFWMWAAAGLFLEVLEKMGNYSLYGVEMGA